MNTASTLVFREHPGNRRAEHKYQAFKETASIPDLPNATMMNAEPYGSADENSRSTSRQNGDNARNGYKNGYNQHIKS
jgi:hypothetical protein